MICCAAAPCPQHFLLPYASFRPPQPQQTQGAQSRGRRVGAGGSRGGLVGPACGPAQSNRHRATQARAGDGAIDCARARARGGATATTRPGAPTAARACPQAQTCARASTRAQAQGDQKPCASAQRTYWHDRDTATGAADSGAPATTCAARTAFATTGPARAPSATG